MFAHRRRSSVIRVGEVGNERPVHAPRHEAHRVARFSSPFSTRFATPFATRFATFPHGFPQFSTLFLRASFARGKAGRGNGIRRLLRGRFSGQIDKMWKNVKIPATPHAGL